VDHSVPSADTWGQSGGPLGPQILEEPQVEILLDLEVDLLFSDITSIYFERDTPCDLRERCHGV
jgi:hypothetical protein